MDDLEQPDAQDSDAVDTGADNQHAQVDDRHDDAHQDPDSQEQAEEEEDEIEVDGKKFAMPKSAAAKLQAERLMQADYTQKTQAVAEERKAVAAEREQVQRQQQESQQYINEIARVVSIDEQLALYNGLNWQQLIDQDPVEAMKLQQQQRALEGQRHQAAQAITHKQQQNALNEQQSIAKQVQEADAYFKREIPGWSNERSTRVQAYAIEQGIPASVLFQAVIKQPALAKILHKAELFDQLEKKQSAAKPKPVVQDKPVTRITATRSSAQRDPEKMNMDEWAAWRNAQRSKKR